MSTTIYDVDGIVYMTLPDPVPSTGDLQGWIVRHVSSGSHGPACQHSGMGGTYSLSRTDVESFNALLGIVADFADMYGYRPRSSRIGVESFRWTFERDYGDGHRGSDMIIASRVH